MNKKGFTLVELLVVIAIISILSILVIPSIVNVNKNVDKRLYAQKVEYIISAAELYASNNPDIFNGSDKVDIQVYELINSGYLKADENVDCNTYDKDNKVCKDKVVCANGCVINPENNEIMNLKKVTVTKKAVGIVAEFGDVGGELVDTTSNTIVNKVCNGFKGKSSNNSEENTDDSKENYDECKPKNSNFNCLSSSFYGKFGTGENDYCHCGEDKNGKLVLLDNSGNEVDACLIVSNKASGEVNNWLKYGSSEANWRVLGLYKLDGGEISAKMITSGVVK